MPTKTNTHKLASAIKVSLNINHPLAIAFAKRVKNGNLKVEGSSFTITSLAMVLYIYKPTEIIKVADNILRQGQ